MCLGIPMQVVSRHGLIAECDAGDPTLAPPQTVDLALVGECEPGTWVLVFLGAARERLTPETARQSLAALRALQGIMSGDSNASGALDHWFADLMDREPPLPDHLKPAVGQASAAAIGGLDKRSAAGDEN